MLGSQPGTFHREALLRLRFGYAVTPALPLSLSLTLDLGEQMDGAVAVPAAGAWVLALDGDGGCEVALSGVEVQRCNPWEGVEYG